MAAAEVRARLVMLESMRLVADRPDPDESLKALRRVQVVTHEGRPKWMTRGLDGAMSAA